MSRLPATASATGQAGATADYETSLKRGEG